MKQSNLSKAVKALEADIVIVMIKLISKGATLIKDEEEFLRHSKDNHRVFTNEFMSMKEEVN